MSIYFAVFILLYGSVVILSVLASVGCLLSRTYPVVLRLMPIALFIPFVAGFVLSSYERLGDQIRWSGWLVGISALGFLVLGVVMLWQRKSGRWVFGLCFLAFSVLSGLLTFAVARGSEEDAAKDPVHLRWRLIET